MRCVAGRAAELTWRCAHEAEDALANGIGEQHMASTSTTTSLAPAATLAACPKAGSTGKPRNPKGKSPLELFKDDYLQERRCDGEKLNPCSKTFWQMLRASWEALPIEAKEIYESKSAATMRVGAGERLPEILQWWSM